MKMIKRDSFTQSKQYQFLFINNVTSLHIFQVNKRKLSTFIKSEWLLKLYFFMFWRGIKLIQNICWSTRDISFPVGNVLNWLRWQGWTCPRKMQIKFNSPHCPQSKRCHNRVVTLKSPLHLYLHMAMSCFILTEQCFLPPLQGVNVMQNSSCCVVLLF